MAPFSPQSTSVSLENLFMTARKLGLVFLIGLVFCSPVRPFDRRRRVRIQALRPHTPATPASTHRRPYTSGRTSLWAPPTRPIRPMRLSLRQIHVIRPDSSWVR